MRVPIVCKYYHTKIVLLNMKFLSSCERLLKFKNKITAQVCRSIKTRFIQQSWMKSRFKSFNWISITAVGILIANISGNKRITSIIYQMLQTSLLI